MAQSQLENRKIASRYAKALFEAAEEHGLQKDANKNIATLQQICQDVPELTDFFANPMIPLEAKAEVVNSRLKQGLSPLVSNLLELLLQNDRLGILPEIIRAFVDQVQRKEGIAQAEVTVPVAMSDKLENQLRTTLEKIFGYKQVDIVTKIDPAIMAGAIVKIGDKIIDGSYLGKLETLRRQVG